MAQKGYIYRVANTWMLRYRTPVLVNGKVVMRQRAKRLATYHSRNYPDAKSVETLAAEILTPINAKRTRPDSIETVASFLEHVYLPSCKAELKPSTAKGYTDMWKLVQPHLNGLQLRDTRTSDIEALLNAVANSKARAKTTLSNVRNFLSGAFRFAIRTDRFNDQNPVREAKVPKGKRPQSVPAYSLEEITAMVNAVNEPARTVLLVAGLSGLRHSEIRGLKWEDFTGDEILVRRSAWRSWVSDEGDTKTEGSSAPVPCVPILKRALAAHRKRTPGNGFMFAGTTGRPLILANLLRRDIKPALTKAGLQWRGWHGFRRGLASNLYRLGVPDMVIQRILRHANVATTQAHYVKTSDPDARAAMKKMERAFSKMKLRKDPARRTK
jgi:integrase